MAIFTLDTCRNFKRNLAGMARDNNVAPAVAATEEWIREQWRLVFEGVQPASQGPRMNFTRWGSWFDCMAYCDPFHHHRRCLFQIWGIKLGFLTSSHEPRVLRLQILQRQHSSEKQASMKQQAAQAALRPVRDSAKNNLHVATLVLSMPLVQRFSRMCYLAARSLREAHGMQAKHVRDAGTGLLYLARQIAGEAYLPLFETFRPVLTASSLALCGFCTELSDVPAGVVDVSHPLVGEEDTHRREWWILSCHIVGCRLSSLLEYLEMYPRALAFLGSPETGTRVRGLESMQETWEVWLKASTRDEPSVASALKESYMNEAPVQCAFLLVAEDEFLEPSATLIDWTEHMCAAIAEKIGEDCFHQARLLETRGQANTRIPPERAWLQGVNSHIISRKYNYSEVNYKECPPPVRF